MTSTHDRSPWQSLAQQARWLADAADRVGQLHPKERVDEDADELDVLDERALAVRSLAAACRRDTYEQLRADGWSVADIAAAVSSGRQAVYKILSRTEDTMDVHYPPHVDTTTEHTGQCRRCGAEIHWTGDDERPTDGAGDLVCDACWIAAGDQ